MYDLLACAWDESLVTGQQQSDGSMLVDCTVITG